MVSARFSAALERPHRVVTVVTATPPGGDPLTVRVKGLSLTVDSDSRIRRRGTLSCFATAAEWSVLSTDGCLFEVSHGIDFGGGDAESVPVFMGEASKGSRRLAPEGGSVSLPLQDLGAWIARAELVAPVTLTAGTVRADAIQGLVLEARPGTVFVSSSGGGGVLPADLVVDGSRADVISTLAADGNLSTYFDGAGRYVIRDVPRLSDAASFTLRQVTGVERARPLDRMYNTVVVSASATDGSQGWDPQIVQVTDPAHPRHPDKIGVVPFRVQSPTAATAGDAFNIGLVTLERVLGSTESLDVGGIVNPSLEAGEVIRVVTPAVNDEPADIIQHFIDSFTLDLVSGGMTLSTRSQGV